MTRSASIGSAPPPAHPPLARLPGLPGLPGAPSLSIDQLLDLGRSNAAGIWPLGRELSRARNHHLTNRASELRDALTGTCDWYEVDVRRIRGELVASHDPTPALDALRMRDWIRIVAAARRGIKLDFKERDAIAPTLDLVRAAGVPDERLIINVRVLDPRRGGLDAAHLRRIRARFPRATVNLSLGDGNLTPARLRAAAELAHAVGGPIAFPLELSRITRDVVAILRASGGSVAAWNDPRRSPVDDRARTRRELRALGVDGMLDLR